MLRSLAQQAKDLGWSLPWLCLQLWHGFDPWPQKRLHAVGMAREEKERGGERKRKEKRKQM